VGEAEGTADPMDPTNDDPRSGPTWVPPPPPPSLWGPAAPPTGWPAGPKQPPLPPPPPVDPFERPPAPVEGPPSWPSPRAPAPAPPRGTRIGAVAALAGLVAALAPRAEWFRATIGESDVTASIITSGWGSVGLDSSVGVPPEPPTMPTWPDWTLAGIPDGAIATALAVVIGLAGLRVLLVGARVGRPAVAALAGTGLLGLGWMVLSWATAHGVLRDFEETFVVSGMSEQRAREAVTGQVGWGFVATAAAFAVAVGAGIVALWSSTTAAPIEPLTASDPIRREPGAAPVPTWGPTPPVAGAATPTPPPTPTPGDPGDRPMPSWESPLPPVPPVVADALGPPRERDAPRTDGRPPSPPGWR